MIKNDFYSKKVLENFHNPKNYGQIKNPDGIGKVGNIYCGDVMWLYLKIKQKNGKDYIKDAKFQTYGCLAAVASSNVLAGKIKNKTINQALKIDKQKIIKELDGLPPLKIHCSVLATDALYEAIYDYLSKNKKKIPDNLLKKHLEIEKEKKEIGQRYKKWINLEEKSAKNDN